MPFEKGHGKIGGRRTGSANRSTTDLKNKIAALVDEQFDAVQADLELMDPKERVTAYLKFLEYVLPKQREQKIDLSTLNDDEIDELLNRAIAKLNNRSNN